MPPWRLAAGIWVGLTLACAPVARAESPIIHWGQVHPYPTGHSLRSVAWGPAGFVATVAGESRDLLFSTDGECWEQIQANGPNGSWSANDVCFANGKYLVVGWSGLILWSVDGRNWQPADAGTNTWLRACAGGNGQYVIAGDNRFLLVSTNAQQWEQRQTPVDFIDLAYGNNLWVATTGGDIYASPDLVNWTNASRGILGPSAYLPVVSFAKGTFLAGGAWEPDMSIFAYGTVAQYSSDGLTWKSATNSDTNAFGEIHGFASGGDLLVAVKSGGLMQSCDGQSWQAIPDCLAGGKLSAIASSAGGRFVAVGEQGTMHVSDGGTNWRLITTNPRDSFLAMTHADGRFVAVGGSPSYIGGPVGSSFVMTSTNGREWQAALTNLENQLSGAAYGPGQWVVCGDDGGIYASTNGIDWTDQSLPPTSHDLFGLSYGNGRFVAFARNRDLLYHSTNGNDWVQADLPLASQVGSARFLNDRFMAVGCDGLVLSSLDGLAWQSNKLSELPPTAPADTALLAITFGKGRYVAGGTLVLAYSLDGVRWMTLPTSLIVKDLQFVDGWFIAVGYDTAALAAAMIASRDGVQWTRVDCSIVSDEFELLASGSGVLVACSGISLYRGIPQDPNGFKQRVRLLIPRQLESFGASGREYRLEHSVDLIQWDPASGWMLGTDQYLLWDTGAFSMSGRFWRTAGQPR